MAEQFPAGTLRLSLPVHYGKRFVLPRLPALASAFDVASVRARRLRVAADYGNGACALLIASGEAARASSSATTW